MITSVVAFEVLRFEAVPAAAGVALVELDGRFAGTVPQRTRLLLEWRERARELPAVVDGGTPEAWSATFAVPLEALEEGAFALVTGRGPVIALPAPDLADRDDDRFVRLARGANDLRHRLAEASASAATASARFGEIAEERDRLAAELAAAVERAETAERSAAEASQAAREIRAAGEEADRSAAAAADELARARAELDAATTRASSLEQDLADVRNERDALRGEMASAAQEAEATRAQLVTAEDEVRRVRQELRDARARAERTRRVAPAAEPEEATTAAVPLKWEDDTVRIAAAQPDAEPADDAPTVAIDEAPGEDADADPDTEERVTALRPRTPHGRRTIKLEHHAGDDVLDPAAVGARYIEPAQTRPPLLALTPARIAVGAALLVLVVALVIIFAGGGLV